MADGSLVATGAVLCAAGLVFGAVALGAQRAHRRWCEGKARADGVVSRLARRSYRGSRTHSGVHTPVVRFRAANNIEYEIDAPEAPRQVGAVVAVAYDPAQPSGGRGVERMPKIAIPAFLLVLGAILVAVGAGRA